MKTQLLMIAMSLGIGMGPLAAQDRQPDTVTLPEIVVRPFNPTRVVTHAATEFQKKRHNDLYVSDAGYVEKATCGGRTCMFTEGVGYLVSFGMHSPIRLDEYSFLTQHMRKSDRRAEWLAHTRHTESNLGVAHQSDMPPGYNFALNAVARFDVDGPLGKSDRYRYAALPSADIPGDELHIDFRPKWGRDGMQGILVVDRSRWEIRRVELASTPFYASWLFGFTKASGRIAYQHVNNRVALQSLEFTIPTDDVLVHIALRSGEPRDPAGVVRPEDYHALARQDMNPFVHFDAPLWPGRVRRDPSEYGRMERELGMGIPLADQFRKNAGQAYFQRTHADGSQPGAAGDDAARRLAQARLEDLERTIR